MVTGCIDLGAQAPERPTAIPADVHRTETSSDTLVPFLTSSGAAIAGATAASRGNGPAIEGSRGSGPAAARPGWARRAERPAAPRVRSQRAARRPGARSPQPAARELIPALV